MTLHLTYKVATIAANAVLGIAVLQGSAQAATLTQFNFNSVPADANPATGTLTPNPNFGAGTVFLVGGITGTPPFATAEDGGGSSDPLVGDDSALNTTTYPAATALNKSAGVQFNVSTVGQQSIEVIFDQYFSATSSRFSQFQYSLDGTTFVDFGSLVDGAVKGSDMWSNLNTFNLSGITGANNNANFAFRIVSAFAPGTTGYAGTDGTYATDGQWRFDMVTVNANATPVPTPALLPGLVGMGLGLLRKRKSEVA